MLANNEAWIFNMWKVLKSSFLPLSRKSFQCFLSLAVLSIKTHHGLIVQLVLFLTFNTVVSGLAMLFKIKKSLRKLCPFFNFFEFQG